MRKNWIISATPVLALLSSCSSSQYLSIANEAHTPISTLSSFHPGRAQKTVQPGEVEKIVIAKGQSVEIPPAIRFFELSQSSRTSGHVLLLNKELYELPDEFRGAASAWDDRSWLGKTMTRNVGTVVYKGPGDVLLTTNEDAWHLREIRN